MRPFLRSRSSLVVSLSLVAVAAACAGGPGLQAPGAPDAPAMAPLRVMSFNIRYGTAADGEHAWPLRRDLALRVIGDHRPDVLGVQEALRFQLDEIRAAYPYLGEAGAGRDDGREAGEYAAVLFDTRRLEFLQSGTLWLSDTPGVPGSTSWGNRIPRIVTWARFRDRASGRAFFVYNTHWDHESQPSRERSAGALLGHIERRRPRDPFLVLGDFNAGETNPAFQTLLGGTEADGPLLDVFRVVHPDATGVGTFHGFTGEAGPERIDAIFASGGWTVLDAEIVRAAEPRDGGTRYPSDHYPVTAEVRPGG